MTKLTWIIWNYIKYVFHCCFIFFHETQMECFWEIWKNISTFILLCFTDWSLFICSLCAIFSHINIHLMIKFETISFSLNPRWSIIQEDGFYLSTNRWWTIWSGWNYIQLLLQKVLHAIWETYHSFDFLSH